MTTVDLKTRDVGEATDAPYATVMPGVAASNSRIVACGGISVCQTRNFCQVYSPQTDE